MTELEQKLQYQLEEAESKMSKCKEEAESKMSKCKEEAESKMSKYKEEAELKLLERDIENANLIRKNNSLEIIDKAQKEDLKLLTKSTVTLADAIINGREKRYAVEYNEDTGMILGAFKRISLSTMKQKLMKDKSEIYLRYGFSSLSKFCNHITSANATLIQNKHPSKHISTEDNQVHFQESNSSSIIEWYMMVHPREDDSEMLPLGYIYKLTFDKHLVPKGHPEYNLAERFHGTSYIGKTKNKVESRVKAHFTFKNNSLIAGNKDLVFSTFGRDAFTLSVEEYKNITADNLLHKEAMKIHEHKVEDLFNKPDIEQ